MFKPLTLLATIVLFVAAGLSPQAPAVHSIPRAAAAQAPADEQKVVFNTKSLRYHCSTREWAKRCTSNRITTTLANAKARHGVACKICGGTCK